MEMLKVVLPVVMVLAIGMLCREKKLITKDGIAGMQSLVMNFTLPAVLFSNFYKTSIGPSTMIFPAVFFLATVGGIFVGKLLCKIVKEDNKLFPFMLSGYEAGMLGYALLGILIGSEKIGSFAMMDMGHGFAIFTVYLAMLKGAALGKKQTAKEAVMGVLKTPVLIAIIVGLILGMSGIGPMVAATSVGSLIDTLCSFISAPTSAVILIVIGFNMKFKGIDWKAVGKAIVLRILMQVVFAAIILGIFYALGDPFSSEIAILSAVMMILLPPPYIMPIYITDEEDKKFFSSAISAYTMLSVVGFFILSAVVLL